MMRTAILSLGIGAALGMLGSVAQAQDEQLGQQLFVDNCSVCHGVTGKGDGDMAGVLNIPVPDLTLLAQQNDGQFPMLKVIHVIDGRTGLRGHGNPMPVFADMFGAAKADTADPYGGVLVARGRVMSVALYLESIQR